MISPNRATTLQRAAGVCLAMVTLAGVVLTAAPANADALLAPTSAHAPASAAMTLPERLRTPDGQWAVFVQTTGKSILDVKRQARTHAKSLMDTRLDQIGDSADSVTATAERADDNTDVLYESAYTVPGVALMANKDALAAIAKRSDVVSIRAIVPKSITNPKTQPANTNSDVLTRSVDAWQQTGHTGKNVNIAVIDTGLDYTHTDFGGPGTDAAHKAALASTKAPDASWYDANKYLGGHDFAGPTYNADTSFPTKWDPLPAPDDNPIDGPGGGHGTHVAGTAAGLGTTPDGSTYRGDYTKLTAETARSAFDIGPGAAPDAGLYSLKIFGDGGGSTDLTGAAFEWVGKALAEGKKIDVINLSVGSDYGVADDPENAQLAALMDQGVLPVVAAGNAGDITDVGGSPGNAERVLTVAASSSGRGKIDQIRAYIGDPATTPPTMLGAQFSQDYTSAFDVTANVVQLSATNRDGCATYSGADGAKAAGKIVWVAWNDADPACGSATRFNNAAAAGAVAVVFSSAQDSFENGIAGNASIPGAQLTASAAASVQAALDAGSLVLELNSADRQSLPFENPAATDTLASFSSRGLHGSIGDVVKPDVAAPGVNVISALSGSGSHAVSESGTSMATPHVAGIAALVVEAHPDLGPDDIKRLVMNSAVRDVTDAVSGVGYSVIRAGTGRVDALAAVTAPVTVRSKENGNLVTASFGVVNVADRGVRQTRTLELSNISAIARTYTITYKPRTETPGVTYTLSATRVAVPAHGRASVTLTLSAPNSTTLRRTLDPTSVTTQSGFAREYLAEAAGVVDFVPVAGGVPSARVAVYAAPRPVSAVTAVKAGMKASSSTAGTLILTGRGVRQGVGTTAYESRMIPLVLGGTDPKESVPAGYAATSLRSVDIRAFGASSTAPQLRDPSKGIFTVGLVMDGPWARMNPTTLPVVSLDLNADKVVDFLMVLRPAGDGVDAMVAQTVDAATGVTVDSQPVNVLSQTQSTNVFDTNVMALPVTLSKLGFTKTTKQTTIAYSIQTQTSLNPRYAENLDSVFDETSTARINVYRPSIWFGAASTGAGTAIFADQPGAMPFHAATTKEKLLLLHLQNAGSATAQTISITRPAATGRATTHPASGTSGPRTARPASQTSHEAATAPTGGDLTSVPDRAKSFAGDGERLAFTGANGLGGVLGIALIVLASGVGLQSWIRRRRRIHRG